MEQSDETQLLLNLCQDKHDVLKLRFLDVAIPRYTTYLNRPISEQTVVKSY